MFTKKGNLEQLSLFDLADNLIEKNDDFGTENKEDDCYLSNYKTKNSVPTELIVDFDRFMNYLNDYPIQLTKKMGYITRKHLPLINERLSIKTKGVTDNSQQQYYPYIHFFYHIAFAGNLINTDSSDSSLVITDRWNDYKQLTDAEKYFFLLETLWVDLNWADMLGHSDNHITLLIEEVFIKLLHTKQLQLKNSSFASFTYDWNYFFLYVEWFGLWICETDIQRMERDNRKSSYYVKSISLTPFAEEIIPILLKERHPQVWNIPFRRESGEVNPIPGSEIPDGIENFFDDNVIFNEDQSTQGFYKAFTDLFATGLLQKTLPRNERKYIHGTYTFKITYQKNCWCKVILGANHTMADLHHIIIDSFQFDDDHLYSFFMDGKKWSRNCIVAPMDNSGDPIATEVKIGSVGLHAKKNFMYLYDYGDEWIFTVSVLKIEKDKREPITPCLLERKGSGPEQYFYDDFF